jgi:3',5'-cyclic AMP phosphodiesterase CpdA
MRIAHLSDLHFGHHDPELARGLAADVAAQEPTLVVVSGDFTQRGTRSEFEQARSFLSSLSAPFFAVPGNHDVPMLNLFTRLANPYALYQQYIDPDLEPLGRSEGLRLRG